MKRTLLIVMVTAVCLWSRHAAAFWWSDSPATSSGLDAAGFDINTLTTVSGTVMTLPERKNQDEQHTVMTVAAAQGTVTVVLGPWWYWEKQTMTTTKNQELTITGSLAQGKDGVLYLFAQRLENRSTGESVTLRSESGKPLWSRNGAGSANGAGQGSGSGPRTGTGSRGSGMRGGRR